MKRIFPILFLLSVIAFAGVSAPAYENSAQFDIVSFNHQFDQGGIYSQAEAGAVEYPFQFWILEKTFTEFVSPVQNENPGLKFYSWQKDKREEIRQHCRSNC